MMNNHHLGYNATVGGIVFTFMPFLDWTHLLQTVLLAGIGAIVSLVITFLFKGIVTLLKNKK